MSISANVHLGDEEVHCHIDRLSSTGNMTVRISNSKSYYKSPSMTFFASHLKVIQFVNAVNDAYENFLRKEAKDA